MARKPFNPDLAVGGASPPAARADAVYSVIEVTRLIKDALESSLPRSVNVAGQMSNVKRHSSGHVYFTLKDEHSELASVMWRSDAARLKFKLEDGLDVVAGGSIGVFERSGRYQLYVRRLDPRGLGALELAFRQRCAKLKAEGLFDAAHKRPLPPYPERIAIVTSPTGAALQDMLDTMRRRYPLAQVYLVPALVQGPSAAASVTAAIRFLNDHAARLGGVDVMIVGRGGGSAEDLAAFNDEQLARAIFASKIPVISAVGHETDITVADLVADVRAATPTAAAELAAPRREDVLDELNYRAAALTRTLRHAYTCARLEFQAIAGRRAFADPLEPVRSRGQRLDGWYARTHSVVGDRIHRHHRRLTDLSLPLQELHPERFLAAQRARLVAAGHALRWAWNRRLGHTLQSFGAAAAKLTRSSPRRALVDHHRRLDGLDRRLELSLRQQIRLATSQVGAQQARLAALGYESTLARGFSITRLKNGRRIIRRREDVHAGDRLLTQVADGEIESRVLDDRQGELFD